MRPIDADALKKMLQNLAHDDWNQITCTTWAEAFEEVADMIDGTPTSDVRPNVHGSWLAIGNTGLATCGCGFITDRHSMYRFCPNCGADMRERRDDAEVY